MGKYVKGFAIMNNTPNYETPDYQTPDYQTPNYQTPNYETPEYNYNPEPVVPQTEKTIGLVSLILGAVGFIINPLYGLSIAAIITGIVGIATAGGRPKTKATIGLVLGIVSLLSQCALDLFITLITMGVGGFSVLI